MNIDLNTKKSRHHYVWQHYLRAWATDGRVFCKRWNAPIFSTATENLGVIRDFYRLKELTPADIAFVDALCISKAPEILRPTLRGWIPVFSGLFALRDAIKAAGFRTDGPASASAFDIAANNIEEELHAHIESGAIPHLDALRDGNLSFLTDPDQLWAFCYYLSVQYFRTRAMRQGVLDTFAGEDLGGVNIEACWGLMSHIVATTVGYSLFVRKDRMAITLLDSPTRRLIASDQPVVNLHAQPQQQAEKLTFYYPISPRIALLLEDDAQAASVSKRTVTEHEAMEFNRALAVQSREQLYAADAADFPSS